MIIGIGVDLIEIDRVNDKLEQATFIKRILSEPEQAVYTSFTSVKRKQEFLAGRFAAKEAYSKALGTGIGKLKFKDISIVNNPQGQPQVIAPLSTDHIIHLSISHSHYYAVANVVIETR